MFYNPEGENLNMLLVTDIGNTNMVVGIYDGEILKAQWRLSSILHTPDELGIYLINLLHTENLTPDQISGAAFASVVPSLDFSFKQAVKKYFKVEPLQVNYLTDTGMKILYKNPQGLGADRIVNSVAGIAKYGAPLIIADYGTAITFDVVNSDGAYLGGAIAPGLNSGISALFSKAAKLPEVALSIPKSVIGQNTDEAIQAGIIFGNAGLTDHIVNLIQDELKIKAAVIATGGHAKLIAKVSKSIQHVETWLTLEGLKLIYDRNNKN